MAHTYVSIYLHFIFSTKNRLGTIMPDMRERLWAYMGGIANMNNLKPICIGGEIDHAHLLLSFPTTITTAVAMQRIKGKSSLWVHETFPGSWDFNWQEGFAAFSVSYEDLPRVTAYIRDQHLHHQHETFQQELIRLLEENHIAYDPRYLWN